LAAPLSPFSAISISRSASSPRDSAGVPSPFLARLVNEKTGSLPPYQKVSGGGV
jgi:hypothetical protein